MRTRGVVGIGLAALAVVAAWVLIAPRELGGPVAYVVIFGTSMEPRLNAGDLVGIRERSDYQAGDVVAYDNKDIGQVVLHRIIRRDGDRYVFQGDNNDFIDPYRPQAVELIGEMWFQAPGVGTVLKRLQAPVPAGVLAGLVGLIAAGGAGARRARRGGIQQVIENRGVTEVPGSSRGPIAPKTVAAGFALALLLFGVAAAFTFNHPDNELTTTRTPYEQIGEFTYSAQAPDGPVYEEDLTTGDPVYLSVVTEIDVNLDYRFETEVDHSVEGTGSIEARLLGPNGWHRTWQVTEAMPITEASSITGTVDVEELRREIEQVERISEVEQQAYELHLAAPLAVEGIVAGTEIEETFEPKIRFMFDEQQLQLQKPADVEAPPVGTPVTTERNGSLTTAAPVPASVELFGRSIDIELARIASLAGLALCLLGLLITGIPWIRARQHDEPSRIRARYGSQLVSARVVDLSRAHSMVEVESMGALAGIAERFDLPILSDESADPPRYVVEGGAAVYVYSCTEGKPSPEELEDEVAGEPVL